MTVNRPVCVSAICQSSDELATCPGCTPLLAQCPLVHRVLQIMNERERLCSLMGVWVTVCKQEYWWNIHFHQPCRQLCRDIVLFGNIKQYFVHVNMDSDRACQIEQHFHTSSHHFAIQARTTVGSLASAHIVLQLSDSTALNSGTRLELIIFSDGASPVPVLSYLPVLAKRVKYAFLKRIGQSRHAEQLISVT